MGNLKPQVRTFVSDLARVVTVLLLVLLLLSPFSDSPPSPINFQSQLWHPECTLPSDINQANTLLVTPILT